MIAVSVTIISLMLLGGVSAEDPQLIVLLTDHGHAQETGDIYRLNIHHMTISRIPVSVTKPLALDYDHTDGLIYFTDVYREQIRRVDINGKNDIEVAKLNSTSYARGLTLDPNTRQVFYTDTGNNVIGRVEMDNFNHTVIVNTGLDKPRGIVADTKNRKLYWADLGANPKIETSDYTGDQRSTLIYTNINMPSGITLDEKAGRLYWTDVDKVESVHVDGRDRITLTTTHDVLFGISLFNGFLYYTDLNYTGIVSSTVDHEDFHFTFWSRFPLLKNPFGIHVYSPNFAATSPCPYGKYGEDCKDCGNCNLNAPCEKTTGICLGTCKTGYRMENCREKCTPGTFGKYCRSNCSETCKPSSACDFISGKCEDGCQTGWKGDNCTEREQGQNQGPPIGLIAGVVCGVVAVIIIIVVVVVVVVVIRKRAQKQGNNYFSGTENYDELDMGGSNPASDCSASVY